MFIITSKLNLDTSKIKGQLGLGIGGPIQTYVDQRVITLMDNYTPDRNGVLKQSIRLNSVIGSGKLTQATPYARYQYYGEIYGPNIPIKKHGVIVGWFSPKKKYPTGRMMKYSTVKSPLAGHHWFDRMKADKSEQLLKEIQALVDRGGFK